MTSNNSTNKKNHFRCASVMRLSFPNAITANWKKLILMQFYCCLFFVLFFFEIWKLYNVWNVYCVLEYTHTHTRHSGMQRCYYFYNVIDWLSKEIGPFGFFMICLRFAFFGAFSCDFRMHRFLSQLCLSTLIISFIDSNFFFSFEFDSLALHDHEVGIKLKLNWAAGKLCVLNKWDNDLQDKTT